MKTVKIKNIIVGEGKPKIIVPLVGKTAQEIIEEANDLQTVDCDLVEWRVDFFEAVFDATAVVQLAYQLRKVFIDKPLLFTFRTKQEGGMVDFTAQQYVELYEKIIESKTIDLLDVELLMEEELVQQIVAKAHDHDIKIVMCHHNFDQTPSKNEIISLLRTMQKKHADICKIAVMPTTSRDVLTLLEATNEMKTTYADRPIVTISMGKLGVISRLSGEIFGSAMTFGAAKKTSAPGQLSVDTLRDLLNAVSL